MAKEAKTHMGEGKKNRTGNNVLGSEGIKGGGANKGKHSYLDRNVQLACSVQVLLSIRHNMNFPYLPLVKYCLIIQKYIFTC